MLCFENKIIREVNLLKMANISDMLYIFDFRLEHFTLILRPVFFIRFLISIIFTIIINHKNRGIGEKCSCA